MEESIKESDRFYQEICNQFSITPEDAGQYSPLVLAYLGDNIYETVNRMVAICGGNKPVNKLHQECSSRAKAATQAAVIFAIEEELNEEELRIDKRGRNATSYTKAKNASVIEYRQATGLEALVGYLYLEGQYERIVYLIRLGWNRIAEGYTRETKESIDFYENEDVTEE